MAQVASDDVVAQSPSRQSRGILALGALFILAAVVVNKWTLERVFSPDEYISSGTSVAVIAAFEACLLLAGLWLLVAASSPSGWSPVSLSASTAG